MGTNTARTRAGVRRRCAWHAMLSGLLAMSAALPAGSENSPAETYRARIARIEAEYAAAQARCQGTDDADICRTEARIALARAIERAQLDGAKADGPAVDAGTAPATGATRSLGTHECAAALDIDERYRCIRNAEQAGRM